MYLPNRGRGQQLKLPHFFVTDAASLERILVEASAPYTSTCLFNIPLGDSLGSGDQVRKLHSSLDESRLRTVMKSLWRKAPPAMHVAKGVIEMSYH